MYLLDTNTVTNAFDARRSQALLRERIEAEPFANIFVCMPTLGEISRGWLASLNEARKHPRNGPKIVSYYNLFQMEISYLFRFNFLPYDTAAEAIYLTLPTQLRQKHSIDCQIASIALSRRLIVVTSNLSHFRQIPGLTCTDWTVAPDEL